MFAAYAKEYGILSRTSRVRTSIDSTTHISVVEVLTLLAAGAFGAAAIAWLPLGLRIPGHAILKAAAPIVLGVAAVPRPFAGGIAGAGAAAALGIFLAAGVGHVPAAAATALLAIGPAIDLAILGLPRKPASVYLRFAVAGLAANLLAFFVRWGTASFALDGAQPHRMTQIGVGALTSFALCGVLAGLLSAAVFFRNSADR
jgi:hypothetical protein